MKEVEKKDQPDIPGGYAPGDGGCTPRFPSPMDYPQMPGVTFPEPLSDPIDPAPLIPV